MESETHRYLITLNSTFLSEYFFICAILSKKNIVASSNFLSICCFTKSLTMMSFSSINWLEISVTF